MDRARFTLVIPIYNEEEVLPLLTERLRAVLPTLGFAEHEVLFVDDGSHDRSRELVEQLVDEDPVFRAVFLTRNFGHQAAVSTGLRYASGSVIAVMDADLQDPPEVLADLVAALDAGADVAFAVRRKRKESVFKRGSYHLFYRLLEVMSDTPIPRDAGDFCCMRSQVVEAMLTLPERNRFVRGLRAWVGFRQVGVEYERQARGAGEPKYGLRGLLGLAYAGLFSFSSLPVKIMQFLGFATSVLALALAGAYFFWYLVSPEKFPAGWATLIISLWFLGGLQMFFMGLLGEYMFRTFDESRARPTALVARVVGRRSAAAVVESRVAQLQTG